MLFKICVLFFFFSFFFFFFFLISISKIKGLESQSGLELPAADDLESREGVMLICV